MKLAGHSQSWSKLEKRFVQNFSVKTSVVHFIKKNPAWCNNVSEFYYSIFIWSSTCFGRHTVSDNVHQLHVQTTFHVWKTRGSQCSFRLLMMGGVSPETCWALYKYGIIKFWYIVASCWIFLYELRYDARIHERQASVRFLHTISRTRANGLPLNWHDRLGYRHIDARRIFKCKAASFTKAGTKERIRHYFGDQSNFKNRASYI